MTPPLPSGLRRTRILDQVRKGIPGLPHGPGRGLAGVVPNDRAVANQLDAELHGPGCQRIAGSVQQQHRGSGPTAELLYRKFYRATASCHLLQIG